MTLERAIAGIFILLCLIYGYTAFISMEANLLPFEKNMTFLPNTMPKWLSVFGVITGLVVVIQSGPKNSTQIDSSEIDYRNMRQYKLGQALLLLGLMVSYALLLRPFGFLAATTLFLAGGSLILGERKYHVLIPIAVSTAVIIWYLVQEVLGIFLRPWPWFI